MSQFPSARPDENDLATGDAAEPIVTLFGPDFPFAYDDYLESSHGLGSVPATKHGAKVAIIGSGAAGMVAAYQLLKMGLHPIVYESDELGGRLRSHEFEGSDGVVAELGGMRFPLGSTSFYHYIDKLGLESQPFPNPLTPAAGSTVISLEDETHYAETIDDLPQLYRDVAKAYDDALEEGANFSALKEAIRTRDTKKIKDIWDPIVHEWDERTFYDFVTHSEAFKKLDFRHREVFGQVGFGTGGWDSDFSNSMLEILRVNVTECDERQRFIVGGVEKMPQGLWRRSPDKMTHWPKGTTLIKLNGGAPRSAARHINRTGPDTIEVVDQWGSKEDFAAILVTCQSHLLTTGIKTDESLLSDKLWMAMDRTRYMQSSKTFVMVDRPFWKDKKPETGRDTMSMTLTDRLTRGTYLFDYGDDKPGVMCLSYAWMTDALKMLPLSVERRVELCLETLAKIYPDVDIASHIVGNPISVSWEDNENFLGAFKGALPGHYRYNYRMYSQFMQADLPQSQRGIFFAGDDIGWVPGWVEGAVQTSLNAVWGIMNHLGGATHADNPGPGDLWDELKPVALSETA